MTNRFYPSEICIECGNKHGRPPTARAIGMWVGKCAWCGKEGPVTAPRDFRFPEWTPTGKK